MSSKPTEKRDLSYYELYLLDYLRQHKFLQQHDRDFIHARAEKAADTYEQERLNGHSTTAAQELAMAALISRLHHSKYDILLDVINTEFEKSVPPALHESLTERLLPFMGKVFSIYDLTDDDFPLTDEYKNLCDELTGAVALYLRLYGIQ